MNKLVKTDKVSILVDELMTILYQSTHFCNSYISTLADQIANYNDKRLQLCSVMDLKEYIIGTANVPERFYVDRLIIDIIEAIYEK